MGVHFYADGPARVSILAGEATTNYPCIDINQSSGFISDYGFTIPSQFRDGQTHSIYVYGLRVT